MQIFMNEKLLIKFVLTETALIQLFRVGLKSSKCGFEPLYQIVTFFRFTNKVHFSKKLDAKKALLMFNEMCSVSI